MSDTYGAVERRTKWLSIPEAAVFIGFGRNSLDLAIALGAIPFSVHSGKRFIEQGAALLLRQKLLALAEEVRANGAV